MSLSALVRDPNNSKQLSQIVKKPIIDTSKPILAPPLTKHFALVGTAFDYLLRFLIKRINPKSIDRNWVAESALTNPASPILDDIEYSLPENKLLSYRETPLTRKIKTIIVKSKSDYESYLLTGELSDDILQDAIMLAQIDPIVRAGYVDKNIGTVDSNDVQDLKRLISIVEPSVFGAKDLCMLNPTFGSASRLVHGADADLLLDDALIEFKTTKNIKIERLYVNELIGYYVLSEIGGLDNSPSKIHICRFGIYFSRYAYLFTFTIEDIFELNRLPELVEWFKTRATAMYRH